MIAQINHIGDAQAAEVRQHSFESMQIAVDVGDGGKLQRRAPRKL